MATMTDHSEPWAHKMLVFIHVTEAQRVNSGEPAPHAWECAVAVSLAAETRRCKLRCIGGGHTPVPQHQPAGSARETKLCRRNSGRLKLPRVTNAPQSNSDGMLSSDAVSWTMTVSRPCVDSWNE